MLVISVISIAVVLIGGQCSTVDGYVCPVQCQCFGRPDGLTVECKRASFSQFPPFPAESVHITTITSGKKPLLQSGVFRGMALLKSLNLKSDAPYEIQMDSITSMPLLESFVIRTNKQSDLANDSLRGVSLLSLTISTKNENLPYANICTQRRLTYLDLRWNNLRTIQLNNCFENLTKLAFLVLENNAIEKIGKDDFHQLRGSKMSNLDLSHNAINSIHKDALQPLHGLKQLTLNNNKLVVIPIELFKPLKSLQNIDFSVNKLSAMPCSSFADMPYLKTAVIYNNKPMSPVCQEFYNLTRLNSVKMQFTALDNASREAISPLRNITDLSISTKFFTADAFTGFNRLQILQLFSTADLHNLKNALHSVTSLEFRKLSLMKSGNLGHIDNDTFTHPGTMGITELHLQDTRITGFDGASFLGLTSLTKLQITSNKELVDFPKYLFDPLVTLTRLELARNGLSYFATGKHGTWGLPSSLQYIDMTGNALKHIQPDCLQGLDNLEYISFAQNYFKSILPTALQSSTLKILHIERNDNMKYISNNTFSTLPALEILTMKNNDGIVLEFPVTNGELFQHLISLQRLNCEGIRFSSPFQKYALPSLFKKLGNLTELSLPKTGMTEVPPSLFEDNHELKLLDLQSNRISTWDAELFKPVQNLETLIVSNNNIMTVSKQLFKYLPSLRVLHISNNPLYCNCDLLWFRKWIVSSNIYIQSIQDPKYYKCEAPERFKDVQLLDFDLPESECTPETFLKYSVTFTAIIVLILVSTLLVYRFRFEINMALFHLRSRQARLLLGAADTGTYDGFVVYASADLPWVIASLLPELEDKRGYSLCLEDRDWLPGTPIIENIDASMENCRKVLLIISPHFGAAPWCEELLMIAQSRLAGRARAALVPIVLKEPGAEQMSASMRALLGTHRCLYWPDNPRREGMFWGALHQAMKKKVSHRREPQETDAATNADAEDLNNTDTDIEDNDDGENVGLRPITNL